jgi:hypothetical protein
MTRSCSRTQARTHDTAVDHDLPASSSRNSSQETAGHV